jgi:hypothetical protein
MNKILNGLTYSYNRNIGWQDRIIRTSIGTLAAGGVIYFYTSNFTLTTILGVISLAQVITVISAKCMICYFTGTCTITSVEKASLHARGVSIENSK